MRREVVLAWCALVIWASVIWGLGGEDFGTDSTSRFLRPLLEWLLPGLSAAGLDMAHLSIRKGFHAFEYGLLGLLALRAIGLTWPMPLARAALIAVASPSHWRRLTKPGKRHRGYAAERGPMCYLTWLTQARRLRSSASYPVGRRGSSLERETLEPA